MKKALSILLAFVFLLCSTGFSINKHFCGNRLKSTDVLLIQNDNSCCGDVKMPEDCCKNEKQIIKIKENFTQTESIIISCKEIGIFALAFTQLFDFSLIDKDVIIQHANSNDPPDPAISLAILYCSILI